jgi:FixJ family two-component response regulator
MEDISSTLKEKLHHAISDIEDEKLLEALYTLLSKPGLQTTSFTATDEQLNTVMERDALYEAGKMPTLSLAELDKEIKQQHGF